MSLAANLPNEVLLQIFSYLDYQNLSRASLVCRTWHHLFEDNILRYQLWMATGWDRSTSNEPNPPHGGKRYAAVVATISATTEKEEEGFTWHELFRQQTRIEQNWKHGRFLQSELPHPEHTGEANSETVCAIQTCGKLLVSASLDGSVRMWNLRTLRLVGEPLRGCDGGFLCVQCDSRDSLDVIISGSTSGDLISWRFSSLKMIIKVTHAHVEGLTGLKFNETVLGTSSFDGTIKIWDVRVFLGAEERREGLALSPIRTLGGHRGNVNAIDLLGDLMVSASADHTIKLWNVSTGICLKTVEEPRSIGCVAFDGRFIISGSRDNSVRIYDRRLIMCTQPLAGHNGLVRAVRSRMSEHEGWRMASWSYDGFVAVWTRGSDRQWQSRKLKLSNGKQYEAPPSLLPGSSFLDFGRSERRVFGVDFNHRWLACCSNNSNTVVWDFADNIPIQRSKLGNVLTS